MADSTTENPDGVFHENKMPAQLQTNVSLTIPLGPLEKKSHLQKEGLEIPVLSKSYRVKGRMVLGKPHRGKLTTATVL